MAVSVTGIPAFEDNYIWLVGIPDSRRVAVVDPGDATRVLDALARRGLELNAILVTHHHSDHIGGIAQLLKHHPVPVYAPGDPRIRAATHSVVEGDSVQLDDGLVLKVIETPGHTRWHACYFGEGVLFSGDTLFAAGCGRLFEGTPEQMYASLEKIAALPDETQVYCAHEYTLANLAFARIAEPENAEIAQRLADARNRRERGLPTVPAPLGLERKTNPFLRYNAPELHRRAEAFAGRALATPAEVFATVRHWKDTLD